MKQLKSKLVALFLVSCLFSSGVSLTAPVTKTASKEPTAAQTAAQKTADKDKKSKINKVATKLLGVAGPLAKKAIKYISDLTEKYQQTLKMSDVLNLLGVPKSPVRKYLEKFTLKTPVLGVTDTGLNLSADMTIDKIDLKAFLEVGLVGKKPYVILYFQSPGDLKLSKIFPRAFTIDAFLKQLKVPDATAKKLAKIFQVPDLFELKDSYLYISTTDIPDHSKLDNVYKGVGFKGQVKFIGFLNPLQKVFGLGDRFVSAEGKIHYDIAGSSFKITVPTHATLFPEKIKLKGKSVTLIPGFFITLAPFSLDVVLSDDFIPAISGEAGFRVKYPFYKDPFEFFGGVTFAGERLKIYGGQRTKIENIFGIKGFNADDFKVGLIWDFVISAELATATAEIGGIGALLPVGVIFKGGVQAGKYNLQTDVDMSLHGTRAIDIVFKLKGTADYKDFVQFWGNVLAKKIPGLNNVVSQLVKMTPPWKFEDVVIDGAWSEQESKKLNMKIGKLQLIPNVYASGELDASTTGISFSGSLSPLVVPNPVTKKPMFSITKSSKRKVKEGERPGAFFDFQMGLIPPTFSGGLDGRMELNMGSLGKVVSESKANLSTSGLEADIFAKLLDLYQAELKLKAALNDKGDFDAKSFFVDITIQTGGLEALNDLLNKVGPQALEGARKKLQGDLDKASKTLDNAIKNEANRLKKSADTLGNQIKNLASRRNDALNKASKLAEQIGKSIWSFVKECGKNIFKVKKCVKKLKKEFNNSKRAANNLANSLGRQISSLTKNVASVTANATRLYGVSVAKGFTEATRQTVKTFAGPALKAYEEAHKRLKVITDQMAQIAKKGFEVNYVNAKGGLAEIYKAGAQVKGKVLGKPFSLKTPDLGFLKTPLEGAKIILKKVGVKI